MNHSPFHDPILSWRELRDSIQFLLKWVLTPPTWPEIRDIGAVLLVGTCLGLALFGAVVGAFW